MTPKYTGLKLAGKHPDFDHDGTFKGCKCTGFDYVDDLISEFLFQIFLAVKFLPATTPWNTFVTNFLEPYPTDEDS